MEDKMNYYFEKIQTVFDIMEKYQNINEIYDHIVKTCDRVLMSKDKRVSLYGMFLPDERMEYCVAKYQGTLTKNSKKMNYKYYFDDQNRVVLTERHYDYLVDYIFYFYENNLVNFLWYSVNEQKIHTAGNLVYVDNELYSFFEARVPGRVLESIYEYKEQELILHNRSFIVTHAGKVRLDGSYIEKYKL